MFSEKLSPRMPDAEICIRPRASDSRINIPAATAGSDLARNNARA
jgi:hypothetical protein